CRGNHPCPWIPASTPRPHPSAPSTGASISCNKQQCRRISPRDGRLRTSKFRASPPWREWKYSQKADEQCRASWFCSGHNIADIGILHAFVRSAMVAKAPFAGEQDHPELTADSGAGSVKVRRLDIERRAVVEHVPGMLYAVVMVRSRGPHRYPVAAGHQIQELISGVDIAVAGRQNRNRQSRFGRPHRSEFGAEFG